MIQLLHQIDPRVALALHVGMAVLVVVGIVIVAGLLREPGRDGFGVYESGAAPGAPLRGPVEAPYFLVAVIFMIFDVEVALLFAWAVAAEALGREGVIVATIFIGMLLAALAYLWTDGALETGPKPRKSPGDLK